jgi:pSer/pThr/pTyr-binding forkhead associated (FHA) protein
VSYTTRTVISHEGLAPVARLVVLSSSDPTLAGREYLLDRASLSVGRHANADIAISDHGVSTLHAVFELRGASWFCIDQGSTNGTWVNDQRARPAVRLFPGAQVQIGATTLQYEERAHSPAPELPPHV